MNTLCATGCGRPSNVVLCKVCSGELLDALRDLSVGWDHDKGERRPPGLCGALSDTVNRQTKLGNAAGPTFRRGFEWRLPFNSTASRLADRLRRTILGHSREFYEANQHLSPEFTSIAGACEWMSRHPKLLANHAKAATMHEEITGIAAEVRKAIDRPVEKVYVGQCSTEADGYTCAEDLYADPNRKTVMCRCGAKHDVETRRQRLAADVHDQLATVADLTRIVPFLIGRELSANSLRTWAANGELGQRPPHQDDPKRQPRYVIGEVVALARKKATRRRAGKIDKSAA